MCIMALPPAKMGLPTNLDEHVLSPMDTCFSFCSAYVPSVYAYVCSTWSMYAKAAELFQLKMDGSGYDEDRR